MAAGAEIRLGLVVGHVGMTLHARRAVRAYLCTVHIVARGALEVTLVLWVARNSMKPGELTAFVTTAARRLCGYRSAVRIVTGHALSVALWALSQLLLVAARTRRHAGELVRCSFVASATARMAEISAS